MAVTGSEIVGAATPRATPYFIEIEEIHAAMRQNLQVLQIRCPSAQRAADKPKCPDVPELSNIRSVSVTFRGGNGWQ